MISSPGRINAWKIFIFDEGFLISLALRNTKPNILNPLFTVLSICESNFKFLSTKTPNPESCIPFLIPVHQCYIWLRCRVCCMKNVISKYLNVLSVHVHQLYKLLVSAWSCLEFMEDLSAFNIFKSPANRNKLEFLTQRITSLINMLKYIGPKWDTWGTPDIDNNKIMHYAFECRYDKYDLPHSSNDPSMPENVNLFKRIW